MSLLVAACNVKAATYNDTEYCEEFPEVSNFNLLELQEKANKWVNNMSYARVIYTLPVPSRNSADGVVK